MPRKRGSPKMRIQRDGTFRWVLPHDVQPGDLIWPLGGEPTPAPDIAPIAPSESEEPSVVVHDVPPVAVTGSAALPAPNQDPVLALLMQMQEQMDDLRQSVADARDDADSLRDDNTALRKQLSAVAKAKPGKAGRVVAVTPQPRKSGEWPVPAYNPIAMDERFQVQPELGDKERPSYQAFQGGVFLAHNDEQLALVKRALRCWGPDKPDKWIGDNMPEVRICKKCGFRTANLSAYETHRRQFSDHEYA